ncbi:DUF5667 domain-containing protein [Patescibacteria group bacterium]
MLVKLFFALLLVAITSAVVYGGATDSSKAGLKPDNPLYFFDTLMEKLDLWGIKDKEEKIKKLRELVEEKLNEASALLEKGDSSSAQKSLKSSDDYINEALDFLNSLEVEGKDTTKLVEDLGETVLKKQELFADIYKNAPSGAQSFIESEIKDGGTEVRKIIESFDNLDAKTNEKLTQKIEQTQELVDDKIEEAKEEDYKEELEDLSGAEKEYNIWIDHFYAGEEDGMTAVSAHIRRRDPECSEFTGKFKVYLNDTFYREFDLTANGYDDIRKTFDKFYLEEGEYWVTGVLEDMGGKKVSNRQFKLVI